MSVQSNIWPGSGLLLALCVACVTPAPEADQHLRFDLKAGQLGEMRHVAVAGSVWTGGNPSLADLDLAQRRGVQLVIDLRAADSSGEDVLAACQRFGLRCAHLPIQEDDPVDLREQHIDRALALLDRGQATLIICEDGSSSATLLALHRILKGESTLEQSLHELHAVGSISDEDAAFLRAQVQRLKSPQAGQPG